MTRWAKIIVAVAAVVVPVASWAEIVATEVAYQDGDVVLQGTQVRDTQFPGNRPVVVVFHDWMGPSEVTRDSADRVAKLGYVAFIADVYGKGVRPTTVPEASAESTKYKSDRVLMRRRAELALATALHLPGVDAQHSAAIGYCFGGTVALELARDGANVAGVVSFHGGLDASSAVPSKKITAKVLALHGADDPFVPQKDVQAFGEEMKSAKVAYQIIQYPGAVHAFTNKKADALGLKGAAYNAAADTKSFADMTRFLSELF